MIETLERPEVEDAEPRYGSAITCQAAGIDAKTLNNWTSREPRVVILNEDERREVGERTRLSLSFGRVVHFAIMAQLVALGVPPRRASMAAAAFTDFGHGESAVPGRGKRNPGDLYEGAYTYLVVPPEGAAPKVIPVRPDTSALEFLDPEFGPRFSSAIVVKVDDIYARVRTVLGQGQG